MANLNATITDLITLANYTITRTETLTTGESVTDAYLAIKEESWDDDADAIILKHITSALTVDGQITDNGSITHTTAYNFLLSDDDTALLKAFFGYKYGIKLKVSGAYRFVELGDLTPLQGIIEEE